MLGLRISLLLSSVLLMITGLWVGLVRLGWQLPNSVPVMQHGPLMVAAFFATLIALERAVGLGKAWVYISPVLLAIGGIFVLLPQNLGLGIMFFIAGSAVYLASATYLFFLQKADFTFVMALGAFALFLANILWAFGVPLNTIVMYWASYLILIISGERLELSRFLKKPKIALQSFVASVIINILGLIVMLINPDLGLRIVAVAFLIMAIWLLYFDIAKVNIKQSGAYRFMAAGLLAGYFWLAVAAIWFLVVGLQYSGPHYDAPLHAVFVGFTFSMVFAHAPVIFPAVLKLRITYSKFLYIPLITLHASLLLRLIGDLYSYPLRYWGGMISAISIVAYFLLALTVTLYSTLIKAKKTKPSAA